MERALLCIGKSCNGSVGSEQLQKFYICFTEQTYSFGTVFSIKAFYDQIGINVRS